MNNQPDLIFAEDVPTHPEPNGAADDDHPRDFYPPGTTFSIKKIPVSDLSNHTHDARCYLPTEANRRTHDIAEDDYEGQHWDYHYVKQMSKNIDSLPLIAGHRDEQGRFRMWGGGHRAAAHAEAGRSYALVWMRD